jgi:hypothetical protein
MSSPSSPSAQRRVTVATMAVVTTTMMARMMSMRWAQTGRECGQCRLLSVCCYHCQRDQQ